MIKEKLESLALPEILRFEDGTPLSSPADWEKRRGELVRIMCEHEYGFRPPMPDKIEYKFGTTDTRFCASKGPLRPVTITVTVGEREFSFPVNYVLPKNVEKPKAVIYMNFRPLVPDKYLPSEELVDEGIAVASFCYTDITSDDGDFTSGACSLFLEDGKRTPTTFGKIALWAWAASIVLEFLLEQPEIDHDNIAVAGHSRLGKTALYAAATDTRFAVSYSNDAGCSGDAISRGKVGESIALIVNRFPYWFCENYYSYADREFEQPFDQHFLLAAIAPRRIFIAAAREDEWADPDSQYLSCAAASEAYDFLGLPGFIAPDSLPEVNTPYNTGRIAYHMRPGEHYHGRQDWLEFLAFFKR